MGYALHSELRQLLSTLRARRGFNAQKYINAKSLLLNRYLKQSGLKSVVVGVSGGIDSALVIAMLAHASKQPDSPVEHIVAALLPYFIKAGTTNQEEATARGREVAEAYGAECALVDLSSSHIAMKQVADRALNIEGDAWAAGQLVSYLRTPALFYLTSLETQRGRPSLLVGTTNRDEGGFIGYFGKAADAMVDLQLISDLHKSEIFETARLLNVPESVLEAAPTGDIYDGRNDEQLIGAPYDFIELYSLLLSSPERSQQEDLISGLGPEARLQFDELAARLTTLNRQNAHKYLGGSPAVHLDVYERAVPGGWRVDGALPEQAVNGSNFVNPIQIASSVIEQIGDSPWRADAKPVERVDLPGFEESAFKFPELLSAQEAGALRAELEKQEWTPVGRDGYLKNFHPDSDVIGSYRATCFNESLARRLWNRMAPSFPTVRLMGEYTPADWDGDPVWRAVGISPVMRFIRYSKDGLLVPHYDAPYHYHDGKRTLMSLVLYLTENSPEDGGATRFIVDPQRHLPLAERDYSDWTELAKERDVLLPVAPQLGTALVFDHRILHDSQMIRSSAPKIIMRTDVVFERCGLPSRSRVSVSRPLGLPEVKEAPDSKPGALSASEEGDEPSRCAPAEPARSSQESANMLAKAKRDRFYGMAYDKLGTLELLEEAGFFDDGTKAAEPPATADDDWLLTPVDKIARRLAALEQQPAKDGEWLAVLLTTGSFNPLHAGHVEMMEIAKRTLESQGATVLGGYLCPSHDSYVCVKCGADALPGSHRLRLCEESVIDSDWLMADGWLVRGVDRELNFTDVITRLESYLSRHVRSHRPLQVVYVFGGDCARFTLTFIGRGRCVCVPRPGAEAALAKYERDPLVSNNPGIVFAKELCHDIASTIVRQGHDEMMKEGARQSYQQWRTGSHSLQGRHHGTYHLRNEEEWALEPWLKGRKRQVKAAWNRFRLGLTELLERSHREAARPDAQFEIRFCERTLREQLQAAQWLLDGEPAISLDPCIAGAFDLAVSRHFALSAGRSKSEIGRRPGHPSLAEQLSSIPAGDYVLFDDDIATGTTMRAVRQLLPQQIRITRQAALTHFDKLQSDALDILDCRDFLAGARSGGLVVRLADGTLGRAPYCLPYVSPSDRVCTPLSKELEFSRELWVLNERFFASISPAITLAQTNEAFQVLMRYVGFEPSQAMTSICGWHIDRLSLARS